MLTMQDRMITKNLDSMVSDGCRFCSLLGTDYNPTQGDRAWMMTDDYAAFISVGALVPGWTLLAPRLHADNMQSSYSDAKFWEFAREAARKLSAQYGKMVAFEHGPNKEESITACGTGHAHLHLVPLSFSLSEHAKQFDPARKWERCSMREIAEAAKGGEYLFVADDFSNEAATGVISKLDTPTSQFFRKVIAKQLGMSAMSDYKRFPMAEIMEMSTRQMENGISAVLPIHAEIR